MTNASYKLIGGKSQLDETDHDRIRSMMEKNCLQMAKVCSAFIGLIVGIFIQASSLGTSFIMTTLYGKDIYLSQGFVLVSLAWCLVASIMGVAVMLLLRNLIVLAFYATNATVAAEAALDSKEAFMINVIGNMEQFFGIGSLSGVGISWMLTDILMGMESHAVHSFITVSVALIWCRCAMRCTANKSMQQEEQIPTKEPLLSDEGIFIALV